ncbi:hypothetical protein B0F90DRAFT_1688739 [Multifurca ochricompacta]|uniref:EF-hand domain-containing protein n=1 Tax=Multifurca ochricompacta TaxID=376703 RepID=A0AAD4QQ46_9AGAM|nr:hypothetical protein B0F90DRAFT_1688739 [Multifurca ochricompacta]
MAPSTLQARIKAFEALGTGAPKEVLDSVAIHSESEHLLDSPHSPTAASIPPIVPTAYTPSTSPNSLQHRSSLLDLKDWVIDDGPFRTTSPTAVLCGYSPPLVTKRLPPYESAPLISFEGSSIKLSKAPPLPPRKPSFNSLRSASAPATSLISSPPSTNMLMPPEADYSYPPTITKFSTSDGIRRVQGHAPASSISSFHSVSLSSDGGDPTTAGALHAFPMEREWTVTGTEDGESLDESFENVSAPSSFLPPITLSSRPLKPPGKPALAVATKQPVSLPPKLPQRPPIFQQRSSAGSFPSQSSSPSSITSSTTSPIQTLTPSASSSSLSLTNTRRVPPPPPITSPPPPPPSRSRPSSARTSVQSTATTASDRSSLFSQATTASRTSLSSRTSVSASMPTPGAKQVARGRYDTLFTANLHEHAPKPPLPVPAKRQNAGWRGLSIDLDLSGFPVQVPTPLSERGSDSRLDGRLVRKIWLKSRLEPQRLRDIWNECDPEGMGSLDRDAFARGMARIDEELHRAQILGRAGMSFGASGRAPLRVANRPILR